MQTKLAQLSLAFLLTAALIACTSSPPVEDVQTVYCLSPDHRDSLITAATSLKIASSEHASGTVRPVRSDSPDMSIEEWRDALPNDFKRACTALVSAERPTPSINTAPSIQNTLLLLLPVTLGALLALAAAQLQSGRTRRQNDAMEIRTKANGFLNVLGEYTRSWRADTVIAKPSAIDVHKAAFELALSLRRAASRYMRLNDAQSLADDLGTAKYMEINSGWNFDKQPRMDRAGRIENLAAKAFTDSELLAGRIEKPILRVLSVRKKPMTSITIRTI